VATRNEIIDVSAHALIGGEAVEEVGFGGRPEKSFPSRRAIMPIGPNSFLKGLNERGERESTQSGPVFAEGSIQPQVYKDASITAQCGTK